MESGKRAQSEATAAVTADPIVNAPPRFTGNRSQSIQETAAGENVGDALDASDRDHDSLTFGLVDSAAASYFEIVPNSGQLRTVETLDFETINVSFASSGGRLIFNATLHDGKDADGNVEAVSVIDATATITITVIDVEEEGTLTLNTDQPQVGETVQYNARGRRRQHQRADLAVVAVGQWTQQLAQHRGRHIQQLHGGSGRCGASSSGPASVTPTTAAAARRAVAVAANHVIGENQRPTFPSTENGRPLDT